MDKGETLYHFPVFLLIVFYGFYRNTLQIAYLAKIVQNKSLVNLAFVYLDADFFDLFIMASA